MRESSSEIRKKAKRKRRRMATAVIVAVFTIAVLLFMIVSLKKETAVNSEKLGRVESQLAEQYARSEELEAEKLYMKSREFIEKIARERLGLVTPGETIIKPRE